MMKMFKQASMVFGSLHDVNDEAGIYRTLDPATDQNWAKSHREMQQYPCFDALSGLFISHLISSDMRIDADFVDQLFYSSEKRLARTLLLLASHGKDGKPETVFPEISQETLAGVIGVARERALARKQLDTGIRIADGRWAETDE